MQDVTNSLEQWGYILLFFYSFGGGYVGLIAAGVMSALGKMDLYLVILVACYQKKDIIKYLYKHKRKIALSQIWLKKYGSWLIVFSKYLYGVKTLVPLAIGFSSFSLQRFFVLNIIACVIWAITVGLCGYYASSGLLTILDKVDAHSYVVPFILLAFGMILYIILSQVSKKAKKIL